MAAIIAGSTERIRVGAAGMLLTLHTPMQVAKSFRLLASLFGGRIDLGVGGGGAEPSVVQAMRGVSQPMEQVRGELPARFRELVALVRGESSFVFNPLGAEAPPLWLLALDSPAAARAAAQQGTCFGMSLAHPVSKDVPSVTALYRDEFRASTHLADPQAVVAVRGLCAESEEEAWRLIRALPSSPLTGLEVVGNPAQCREQLEAVCHRYGTDELVFLDGAPDAGSRRRCFQLLAAELRLAGAALRPAALTGS